MCFGSLLSLRLFTEPACSPSSSDNMASALLLWFTRFKWRSRDGSPVEIAVYSMSGPPFGPRARRRCSRNKRTHFSTVLASLPPPARSANNRQLGFGHFQPSWSTTQASWRPAPSLPAPSQHSPLDEGSSRGKPAIHGFEA
eukprot:gnl/TRDRNA2_/TRDRNA2_176003_c1_seq15.p1 gnl/TRDRNA2_/TRDRNA2_176003_c1~~gnl/TRDRNA2_/TRDRNA2_176003_c1_seq15.p1  ORF type:complete len:141 (+),score=8.63 gnl/TRDRNA2_/TRDRNA2_176003_c1_seq15:233-655(+)